MRQPPGQAPPSRFSRLFVAACIVLACGVAGGALLAVLLSRGETATGEMYEASIGDLGCFAVIGFVIGAGGGLKVAQIVDRGSRNPS